MKRIAIGAVAIMMLVLGSMVVYGVVWLQGERVDSARVVDVADFRMANFADYDVVGVDLTVERRIPNDMVPGPEDSVLTAFGYVELDPSSMERLRGDFAWVVADAARAPARMDVVLPPMDLLSSRGFDASFDLNHDYKYGLAWIAEGDPASQSRVYFFTSNKPVE